MVSTQVTHIVSIHLKPEGFSEENMKNISEKAQALAKIDGVLSVDFGRNFTERIEGGLNVFVLHVEFKDKQALQEYTPHSIHQEFISAIAPFKISVQAVDFVHSKM